MLSLKEFVYLSQQIFYGSLTHFLPHFIYAVHHITQQKPNTDLLSKLFGQMVGKTEHQ